MNKMITARHLDLDPATRDHIFAEMSKLAQSHPHLQRGETVLDCQRGWFRVEIILRGRRTHVQARAKARVLDLALAAAGERADRQLRERRERTRRSAATLSLTDFELHLQELELQAS